MSTILKNLKKHVVVLVAAGALAPQMALAHGGGGGMGGGRSMSQSMGHATRFQSANFPPVGTPPIRHPAPPFYPIGSNIGINQGNLKALSGSATVTQHVSTTLGSTRQTSLLSKFNQSNITSHKEGVGAPRRGALLRRPIAIRR